MGAELVYKAKNVVLLANGERKIESVTRSLLEKVTSEIPISYGQKYAEKGGNLIYVIDKVAGRELLAKKDHLVKRGIDVEDLTTDSQR
jgi:glucosamine-6-phosphate deaminase